MFSGIVGEYGAGAAAAASEGAHAHSHGEGSHAHSHGAETCADAACGHAHGAPPPARVVLARGDADGRCGRRAAPRGFTSAVSALCAALRAANLRWCGRCGADVAVRARRVLHSHDGLAPHYHEPIPSPGEFGARAPPLRRDYAQRSFTVGIGGPVGTGCAPPACAALLDRAETLCSCAFAGRRR